MKVFDQDTGNCHFWSQWNSPFFSMTNLHHKQGAYSKWHNGPILWDTKGTQESIWGFRYRLLLLRLESRVSFSRPFVIFKTIMFSERHKLDSYLLAYTYEVIDEKSTCPNNWKKTSSFVFANLMKNFHGILNPFMYSRYDSEGLLILNSLLLKVMLRSLWGWGNAYFQVLLREQWWVTYISIQCFALYPKWWLWNNSVRMWKDVALMVAVAHSFPKASHSLSKLGS